MDEKRNENQNWNDILIRIYKRRWMKYWKGKIG